MAKSKSNMKGKYISKGERPSVNKETKKIVRRARLANRPVEDILKSLRYKDRVIAKPQNKKEEELKKKYLEQNRINARAEDLLSRYGKAGLTRAGAVQAVLTDTVASLIQKWKPRLSAYIAQQKEYEKRLHSLKLTGANVSL